MKTANETDKAKVPQWAVGHEAELATAERALKAQGHGSLTVVTCHACSNEYINDGTLCFGAAERANAEHSALLAVAEAASMVELDLRHNTGNPKTMAEFLHAALAALQTK